MLLVYASADSPWTAINELVQMHVARLSPARVAVVAVGEAALPALAVAVVRVDLASASGLESLRVWLLSSATITNVYAATETEEAADAEADDLDAIDALDVSLSAGYSDPFGGLPAALAAPATFPPSAVSFSPTVLPSTPAAPSGYAG